MINSAIAAAPISNQPQREIEDFGVIRDWVDAWKTVICAEVISAVTKCEELLVDPLRMNF
jgi:hypothetical protein